jgi:putative two-component system response regulator
MSETQNKKTVLAVDDTPDNLVVVKGILVPEYTVKVATNGEMALKIAKSKPPDLILLDIMMPEMDGYAVCRSLKEDKTTREIPIIFLTGMAEVTDETKGLELGAVDYITKPISPPILKARVNNHILLKQARDFLKKQNEILEEKVAKRTRQISQLHDATMVAMGSMAESRDPDTGNHIRRTQHYVKVLANQLSSHQRFKDYLTPETIELIFKSAPLHDIGKIGVPDNILLKPGPLTDAEYEIMKKHTTYGRDAILAAEKMLDEPDHLLCLAREIAYSHQEYWDGSGYPEGLVGEDIPIAARLMALADVYDALVSKRIYKSSIPHQESVEIIKSESGSHFDPDVVTAFLEVTDQFHKINKMFMDN